METIGSAVAEANRNAQRSIAVEKATSELALDLHSERIVIELAIKSATTQAEIDARGPDYRERFEAALRNLDAVLDKDTLDADPIVHRRVPSFDQVPTHTEGDINQAIQQRLIELRNDRQAFLSGVRTMLTGNAGLRNHFLKRLHELNAKHYLLGLDPTSDWSLRQ